MLFAEADEDFLSGFVFDAFEGLEGEVASGVEAGLREEGSSDDVEVGVEGVEDAIGEAGGGEAGVVYGSAAGSLESEAVEEVGELSAVARTGAAEDEVGEDGGGAGGVLGVEGGAGGEEEGHGSGLHAGHGFGEEGEAVGEGMLVIAIGQVGSYLRMWGL